MRDLELQKSAG